MTQNENKLNGLSVIQQKLLTEKQLNDGKCLWNLCEMCKLLLIGPSYHHTHTHWNIVHQQVQKSLF